MTRVGLPWRQVEVLSECSSTNAVLVADPVPWRVVTTDHQVSGRGRLARSWQTPPLAAVALSAVLPLPAHRLADAGRLPLVTGLAVRAALAHHGLDAGLKWPNDVLVPDRSGAGRGDGKVCGILCEVVPAPRAEGDADGRVVVGVGINVDQRQDELPELPGPLRATSMALEGCADVDRDRLVADVLRELATRYDAWAAGGLAHQALTREYDEACLTLGREVEMHLPTGVERGRALRVDAQGRLVVAGPAGERSHAAGDVVHARLLGGPP